MAGWMKQKLNKMREQRIEHSAQTKYAHASVKPKLFVVRDKSGKFVGKMTEEEIIRRHSPAQLKRITWTKETGV